MPATVRPRLNRLWSLFNEWAIDGVLGEAPRLVFGNSAGLVNNVGPALSRRERRSPATLPEVNRLRRDGYALREKVYEPERIAGIIRKFQRLIEDLRHSRATSPYSVELTDALRSIPELRGLLNEQVRQMLHEYFGSPFRVVETQAFRTFPIPESDREKEAYSNFWHCDAYPASWVKLYVFLSDWTPASGGTEILPIRTTKKVMRSGYVNRYFTLGGQERLARMTAQHATAVGSAGSVFMFNPQRCLHRAGIPRDGGHRDAMMFFVAGCSASAVEAAWESLG